MRNPGEYQYYGIQARIVARSPWCKPNGKFTFADTDEEWFEGGGNFMRFANPCKWVSNTIKYKYPAAMAETDSLHQEIGFDYTGWRTLKYAEQAMKRMEKASECGDMDYKDNGKKTQAVRYEFRIIRYTYSKKMELVTRQPGVIYETLECV